MSEYRLRIFIRVECFLENLMELNIGNENRMSFNSDWKNLNISKVLLYTEKIYYVLI